MCEKRPLGVKPEKFWKIDRLKDLNRAIDEYEKAGRKALEQWEHERNRLYFELQGTEFRYDKIRARQNAPVLHRGDQVTVKDEELGLACRCIVDDVKGDGTITLKGRLTGNG